MSRRVLITGINGFAGRYLAPLMASQGFEVAGVAHSLENAAEVSTNVYAGDLRDLNSIREIIYEVKPTHVVHLAAISFVGHDNISEIYDINVVGTKHLLIALNEMRNRPESILLTSSANIYGNSSKGILDEEDAFNPANDYANSKIAMEFMARQFSETLRIVCARPFNYTGIGQSENFLIPKIASHFRRKLDTIYLGNTDVSRDFSDVRTVVRYFSQILQAPFPPGAVYNVCSGRPLSLKHILDLCRDITGHELNIEVDPKLVRKNEIMSLVGNPAKLHQTVGAFEEFSIEDTLRWMLLT